MNGTYCFCSNRTKRKIEVKSEKKKFLRIIEEANVDPLNNSTRRSIISQINRGTDLKILEIGDFTPEKSVGSGASSDVCLLVRKDDGQKFAGKFVKGEIGTKDFINEATILKSCSTACATIVNLVGITTTPKCLVLEFYENGSLDKALRKDNLNVERGMETEFPFLRRLGYILDMCKAVHQLHRENICHRDIAMRNLLLSDDKEHVILTDFSLSRIVSSAFETQSTLTTLVPTKSAPETFRKSITSKSGHENWKRYYSLKSDIWSLGVTMFEIIDKEELGDIKERKHMPSRFPTERLPPTKVFNRMQDLWILVLRCWNQRPEDRPQSWDVQERIERLISDPWNIGNEDDGYIRAPSKGFATAGSTFDDQRLASCCSQLEMSTDCNWMDTVYEDEYGLPSGSLQLESPSISILAEQESPKSIMPSMMKDFFRKMSSFAKRRDIGIHGQGVKGQLINKQKWLMFSRIDSEKTFNKNLSLPSGTPNPNINTLSQHFSLKQLHSSNFPLQRNKSDPSISNSQLMIGKGFKFLKSLGSVSSMLSNSFSSRYEESIITDRVQYCSPLSLSFNSTVTNMRYCKDRGFFRNRATMEEKPNSPDFLYTPDTPNSEMANEQPTAFVLSETPRVSVVV